MATDRLVVPHAPLMRVAFAPIRRADMRQLRLVKPATSSVAFASIQRADMRHLRLVKPATSSVAFASIPPDQKRELFTFPPERGCGMHLVPAL